MIWFMSDTHFGHANVFVFCERTWETIEEIGDALFGAINARVAPGDALYRLGDFSSEVRRPAKTGEAVSANACGLSIQRWRYCLSFYAWAPLPVLSYPHPKNPPGGKDRPKGRWGLPMPLEACTDVR